MPEDSDLSLDKAAVFFERARKIAETNNFDYAIDMYIEGLRCAPDSLENGHMPLRKIALMRQVKGGKKPSIVEKLKKMRSKMPLEQMLNAEYLFAKDPDHLPYTETILKAAIAGDYMRTALWIADFIFEANRAADEPSFQTFMLLKDSYSQMERFDRALGACQAACNIKPQDAELADEFKRLSAELTVSRGKYDKGGNFRDSIKNREAQESLLAQDRVVKTKDYRISAIEHARRELARNPDIAKNIFNLAEALSEMQNDKSDSEAIELLEKSYEAEKDFSFKQRAGSIKIKHSKRKLRIAKDVLEAAPDNAQAKAHVSELTENLNKTSIEHYRLCVENYPTDLQLKYEYAVRLVKNKKYDEAIPLFQEAQHDPRHKITSMSKIGLCFYMKSWYADAVDIFTQTIEIYESQDDSIAKELKYNLARSYDKQGNLDQALQCYRKIAQIDFGYKDVRQRIDDLRKQTDKPTSQ